MKKLFTTLYLMAGAACAMAQGVTLNQSSYANLTVTSDTFARISSSYPAITPGANQQYDFSGVVYDNTRYYSEQSNATNPAFPNATFWGPRAYTLGTYKLEFKSKRWSGVTPNGLERIGESIERQAVHLTGVPAAAATDSLVILKQDVIYSSSYPLIKFPASLNSTWTAKFDFVVNMELTYANAGLNKAPMQYKITTEYTFDCKGDGTAYIVRQADNTFGEDKVLMVRIAGKTTDSFFVNGTPGTPQLLTTLGLVQNQVSNNHWDELFRDNEVSALVLYYYGSDNTYTTPTQAEIHQQRVPFAAHVNSVSADGSMKLYPNPVMAGGQLSIDMQHPARGQHSYRLCSISGAVADEGTIDGNGQRLLDIPLSPFIKSGIYWLSLYSESGHIATAPVQVTH